MRKPRDDQIPGQKKDLIPAAAADGGVTWIRLDNVPVMGRVMVISKQTGMASSYDCCICQCPATFDWTTFQIDPTSFTLVPSYAQQCEAYAYYYDCNGNKMWTQLWLGGVSWWSDNSSVAAIDGSVAGQVDGVGGGSTEVYGSTTDCWNYQVDYNTGQCACTDNETGTGSSSAFVSTPVQHTYPNNPFGGRGCWISQFFDHISSATGRAHHAEDVVDYNGQNGGITPALGDPVYASEGGTVVSAPSAFGPASPPYPNCGSHDANYVKIKGTDNYFTVYIHIHPIVGVGQVVNAGDEIGTVDNSGCEDNPHVHIQREDASLIKYNFKLPCVNSTPTNGFWDGLVDDIDNDY